MPSRRDDDFLDFLLAHHAGCERGERCFQVSGRHVCARCSGICSGAILCGAALLLSGTGAVPFYPFLPLPAFLDWGGRKLGVFDAGKPVSFATGAILGAGWIGYIQAVPRLDIDALFSAGIYVLAFAFVSALSWNRAQGSRAGTRGNPKAPSA